MKKTGAEIPEEPGDQKLWHLVIFREGTCYLPGPHQPGLTARNPHHQYISRLQREGRVAIHGPVNDESVVKWAAVFSGADRTEVQRLADDDPDVRSGMFIYEIHPWPVLGDTVTRR